MFKIKTAYKYLVTAGAAIVALLALVMGVAPGFLEAASHREAPLISQDPAADISDFFMFRSYEPGRDDKVVMIMDVIPGEEPSSGPNYWNFDPNVRYEFHVDNNMNGKAKNVEFYIQFKNEFRGINNDANLFLSYVALPPITNLDGAGSEGLGLRQRYTVTMVKDGKSVKLAEGLIAVPSNVGPRTMPNYDGLAAQGIYELDHGIRVFAGQRDDPFYIDLGAIFDTLNLRSPGTDMLSGFNVNTIALEVPISLLTADGKGPADTQYPLLGAYAATSRRSTTVLRGPRPAQTRGAWVQVQRLANPLVNEAIIGTEDKDRWNALDPSQERFFLDYYQNLRLDTALEAVFQQDAAPLLNIVDLLLKYPATQAAPAEVAPAAYDAAERVSSNEPRLSELLRLNVQVAPTALANQKPLTVLDPTPDNAGWPNGRRPIDDVTDVAIKVIGGTNYLGATDGVDANDMPLPETFPFLSTPHDGFTRQHDNP
ncbi:MAG: DUF4331 domain-containing protein [Anaerolineae bacterium]